MASATNEVLTPEELSVRKQRLANNECPGCGSKNNNRMGAWNPTIECSDCKGFFNNPEGTRSALYR